MYRKTGIGQRHFEAQSQGADKGLARRSSNSTRDELRDTLEKAGIAADNGQRLAYIVMHAELDGLICSGPRRGKQFTYALLDERVPACRHVEAR